MHTYRLKKEIDKVNRIWSTKLDIMKKKFVYKHNTHTSNTHIILYIMYVLFDQLLCVVSLGGS